MKSENTNKAYLQRAFSLLAVWLAVALTPTLAHAYLGPGAGLGLIGSLIAVVILGLVVVLGLVVYPIRMMRKRKNQSATDENSTTSD